LMRDKLSGRLWIGVLVLLAPLLSVSASASAAPSSPAVVQTGSVSLAPSIAVGEPSHHFGFSQASVLAQVTAATITKSDSPDPVAAGGTLTFSIPVSNATNAAVTNVQVTDTLPAGLTLTATPTSTVGTCTGAVGTSTFTCTIGTLGVGQTATITATALVPLATANGTVITNTATLTFTGAGNVSQTVAATSSTTVSGAAGALTITKTGSPATVTVTDPFTSGLGTGFGFNPGLSSGFSLLPPATLTYTVTVSNPATAAAAQNVVVTDTLPANVSFVSATSTVGTCTGSTGVTTVTCNVGTLNAGQTATITIVVNVISSPAACNTTLTNTASVTATGLTAPAPATTTTTVTCPGLSGQGLPLLPPPPLMFLPPPPPPLLPPPPGMGMGQMAAPRAAFPEVPVIPEADSLFLLVGGLVALGGLVGYRKLRRRDDA
jgi:uncharacterized repeat protein (TIGR01451 family)